MTPSSSTATRCGTALSVSLALAFSVGFGTPAAAAVEPVAAPATASYAPGFIGPVAARYVLSRSTLRTRRMLGPLAPRTLPTAPTTSPTTTPTAAPRTAPVPAPAPVESAPTTAPVTSPSPLPAVSPAPVSAPVPAPLPVAQDGRGPQASYVPVGDVVVPVGTLHQSILDAAPEGTRFVLATGVHRLTGALTPRRGQQLLGQYGAVVSGAKLLTGWVAAEGAWYVAGQTQRLPVKDTSPHDVCLPGAMCHAAEDVFVDDVPLRQVGSRAAMVPGTFFFDYTENRIWVASDPTARRVETTVVQRAIHGAKSAALRNLVVEKFGNTYQSGAISGEELSIVNCLVRLNHGGGIFSYGGELRGNVIDRNGQIGLGGGGTGQVVEDNEIVGNNTMGFDPGWEAGGTKFAHTTDLLVRRNWVHGNEGNGLWTDIDNIGTVYEGNLVEDNTGIGIFHEISYRALIKGNVVRRNGSRSTTFNGRVGINVTNSPDVVVTGNTVEGNAGGPILAVQDTRGSAGKHGPRELRNLLVEGNTMRGGGYRGVWVYDAVVNRAEYFATRNLAFRGNRYALPSTTTKLFLGGDATLGAGWDKTWTQWTALGQDAGSTTL